MEKKLFSDLNRKAEEFGQIAKEVNEASKKRKDHSEEAITLIKQSLEIGEVLNHEIEIISKTNSKLRDQDNIVLNTCIILKSNLERQSKIIETLKNGSYLGKEKIEALEECISGFSESLEKALPLIQKIIKEDNEIVLMDSLIINRKKFQRESIQQLKNLAFKSLEDAENAIRGSSSNLRRGLQMVERLKKVKDLIKSREMEELNSLIDDANMGWNIATNVNRSSRAQKDFAEKVHQFTRNLHEDSNAIKDLVIKKHELFNRNLEFITELTVLLSLEFNSYHEAMEIIKDVDIQNSVPTEIRDAMNNLISYVTIACKDIEFLSNLNYDMTDSIRLNADLEKKSVDLTNMELEYYDQIKSEVHSMTEATTYPIEGSEKNIENGKHLEQILKKIASTMGKNPDEK